MSTPVPTESPLLDRIQKLLGGPAGLSAPAVSRLEAHEMLERGLPADALTTFVERSLLQIGPSGEFVRALGMSMRTFQRRRSESGAGSSLSAEQSSRLWKLAEVIARAQDVFGSEDEAAKWLARPAIALDQRRPIDLLATSAGIELVEELLTRLDQGVYT